MNKIRLIAFGFAALPLVACAPTTGGGGGAGAGAGAGSVTSSGYATALAAVQNQAPTGDMPTTLNATYTGATRQDIRETQGGAVVGELMADLELTANWTDGQAGNPWSGKADNFRGDLNGTDFAVTGELTVANAEAKNLTSTIGRSANTINLPGGGTTTVATGAAMVNLAGDVSDGNGVNNEVIMTLGGSFFGSGAAAITGPAQTQGFRTGGVHSDLIAAGDYYAEK